MRYLFVSQLYWPIWLSIGSWAGIVIASVAVITLWQILWRLEFGVWMTPANW